MRELLDFFVRNSKWFVFMICVLASCAMLFSSNPYQHHVYLTSANAVTAAVYSAASNVHAYFNLRDKNDDLNMRNAELQKQVIALKQQLTDLYDLQAADTVMATDSSTFEFVVAHVISNSIARPFNYITIDKGSADGIAPDMGVIDQNGVVGLCECGG